MQSLFPGDRYERGIDNPAQFFAEVGDVEHGSNTEVGVDLCASLRALPAPRG